MVCLQFCAADLKDAMVAKHSIENMPVVREITALQKELLSNMVDKQIRDAKLAKLCAVSQKEDARLKKPFVQKWFRTKTLRV